MRSSFPITLHLTPGSHFDLGWCASPAECLAYSDEILKKAVDAITGSYPRYRFTIEYAYFLRHFLNSRPGYRNRVRRLLHNKKLQVCATMTGAIEQILGGELLIRQITFAKHWLKQEFNLEVNTCQHSDLPGHTCQMPQILAKAGVKHITYSRFHPPVPLFRWQAPDGSQVIAAHQSFGYNWGMLFRRDLEEVKATLPLQIEKLRRQWPCRNVLMSEEQDLFMPDPGVVLASSEWNKTQSGSVVMVSTVDDFFKSVVAELGMKKLPVYQGEMPYAFYSIPAFEPETYKEARFAENALLTAEKVLAMKSIFGLGRFPHAEMNESWEKLFYAQDHNVGGRHGQINDEVRTQKGKCARITAEELSRGGMVSTMTQIAYGKGMGDPVVVFNPLSWKRADLVEFDFELGRACPKDLEFRDSRGKIMRSVVLNHESAADGRIDFEERNSSRIRLLLETKGIPSIGYKVFYISEKKALAKRAADIGTRKNPRVFDFENRYFKLTIAGGMPRKCVWKRTGINLIRSQWGGFGDIVVKEDTRWDLEDAIDEHARFGIAGWGGDPGKIQENFTGKEWRFFENPVALDVIEANPLRTIIKLTGRVSNSTVEQFITLYEKSEKIDIRIDIDWEGRKNTMVEGVFPFNIRLARTLYEVPFGSIEMEKDEMPGTYRGSGGRFVQNWINVSNDRHNIVFCTRNCSHRLQGATIFPILLRTAYSCGTPYYWYENKGRHRFDFSIVPRSGKASRSFCVQRGMEFNQRLLVGEMVTIRPIMPMKDGAALPEEESLASVDRTNVVLSSLKPPEMGSGWEMRLFEVDGRGCKVCVSLMAPIERAWETSLMGNRIKPLKVRGHKIELNVTPFGIHTIRFIPGKYKP
ncbi:MAG: glycoside hydrolase family 38 C-terminal domain-containing protein [Verrucomicrobiae bacterium]|nr:glycoside hydrolase family 38 C-terminal domain-containing protein [Verrucomicrobiae bacterium]